MRLTLGQMARKTLPRSAHAALVLATAAALLAPTVLVSAAAEKPGPVSIAQLRDAWLSADAVVLTIYTGADSGLGRWIHTADIRAVWMGTPAPGKFVFKAPRGVDVPLGTETLLFLWDRLNGVTDSYIEAARDRYGDAAPARIAPDSITAYLLPFSQYALPLDKGKLEVRSQSMFPDKVGRKELRKMFQELEYTLLPPQLYARSDLVIHARVDFVDVRRRVIEGMAVEYRVYAAFEPIEVIKGTQPDSLKVDFGSFPRSPRFVRDEQVILFLKRAGDELLLEPGKRAVYHVRDGSVGETGQPLREFFKTLRAAP